MGRDYQHFSLEERCTIAQLRAAGQSIREIAAALDRSPSSVSRELKRNSGSTVDYKPSYANDQAKARRWCGSRLLRDVELQETVLSRLAAGWSPEQVSGRLARERGQQVISYESIYRFIFAQIARTKDYRWRLYLPRAKSKRGWRGRKGGSSALHIKNRCPITARPPVVCDRAQPGHWEADLMLFAKYGQVVLALHERTSRVVAVVHQPSKAAEPIARTLDAMLAPLPSNMRRTITFDNGSEFAYHFLLHEALGMHTFFCDPHAPWQKGGIENAIGRIRRSLPRKTDLTTITPAELVKIAQRYNHTPRRCLDFLTPAEVFSRVLHFECETTFPPSRE